jgi:acetyl/propionyl-CoA carboxylase alpha subunit
MDYDPLLAKLTVWAENREAAIGRMRRALAEYRVLGITTNLALFEGLMRDDRFRAGDLDTGFLEGFRGVHPDRSSDGSFLASLIAAASFRSAVPEDKNGNEQDQDRWRVEGRRALLR